MIDETLRSWMLEINDCLESISFEDGEKLWSNYQEIAAMLVRFQQIHNTISWDEVEGTASPERKKFRTTILDSTLERLEKVAAYESRKLTALQIEKDLSR